MFEKLKELEQALMVLYNGLQDPFPKLRCLSFSVSQIRPKEPSYIYGFIHIGSRTHMFNRISDLVTLVKAKIEKDQILYQNFDRLRKALK